MTKKQFLAWMNKNRPTTEEELGACPVKFKNLGVGSFRSAHRVMGTGLVVKIPLDEEDSIDHAQNELDFINKCNKIKHLKRYMPKIYYKDYKHGVVVMQFYKRAHSQLFAEFIVNLLNDTMRVKQTQNRGCIHWTEDISGTNLGMKEGGGFVLLDCGLMGGK